MKKIAMCLVLGLCIVAAAQDKPKASGKDMAKPMEKKAGGEGGQMNMAMPNCGGMPRLAAIRAYGATP